MCPCRGRRGREGGEGRVQAERPTHTRPQGQGNGPEGERRSQRNRSPCPGRRCPCGCPQQVVRIDQPLARGVARWHPGCSPPLWPAPLRPVHIDETHEGCPRRRLGASRRTAREVRGARWTREAARLAWAVAGDLTRYTSSRCVTVSGIPRGQVARIHLKWTLRSSTALAAGRVALGLIRAIAGGRM